MMGKDVGRVPEAPGSREPSPEGLGPLGFDPSRARSIVGTLGIRREGEHWRCFDDAGDYTGMFETADAARWGCWVPANDAIRINCAQGRLITENDTREAMRSFLDNLPSDRDGSPKGGGADAIGDDSPGL